MRNARRRPREGALVSLGCLLGTALIVGSSAVGSSYTVSVQRQAFKELGPLDAIVSYENRDNWSAANARLAASLPAGVDFAAAVASAVVPLTSPTSSDPAPAATLIEADYRRATDMLDGDGAGPGRGTAWASRSLADRLHLRVGTVVTAHVGETTQRIEVKRITDRPLAKFTPTSTDNGMNLLVAPGTIDGLRAVDPDGITPRWLTVVAAKGPHGVTPPSEDAVSKLERTLTRALGVDNPRITMVRQDRLERAISVGQASSRFLTTIGAFSILSGALLLVNVLLMLAEERLSELGTMRAVGLPRGALVQAFTLEGAVYAFVGAVVGALSGVGLGRFMVWIAQKAGSPRGTRTFPNRALQLHFAITRHDMLKGLAAGFLLSTLVAALTSFRISRFDVIRSLRELPATPSRHRRVANTVLWSVVVLSAIGSVVAFASKNPLAVIVVPTLLTTSVGVIVARRYGWKAGITAATVPNIIWATLLQVISEATQIASASVVLGGMLLVTSGVLLVNAHQSTVAHLVRRIGRGRVTVTSRLGLANPLAHRVRTLLTVGPLALVVFTLAYAEGLSGLITHELRNLAPTLAGDYQVFATSSPANPFDFAKVDRTNLDALVPISSIIASFMGGTSDAQRFWTMTAFSKDIADHTPPRLITRADKYADDAAVFRAVAKNPDLIIVPSNFLFTAGQRLGRSKDDPTRTPRVGDDYTIFDAVSGQSHDVTVAGVGYADVAGFGAMYGLDGAREIFGSRLVASSALIDARGDAAEFAHQLNRAGVDNGMDAVVVADIANEQFQFVSSITNLYRADLGIGLIVGVAGIGVVLVRSVRDRRQQIGTLRAMGIDSAQVGWSFLLEGGFVAAQGVGVGAVLGSAMVMALAKSPQIRDVLGFNPAIPAPSASLFLLALGLLVASLLASVAPARAASRIPPAVALRLVD
jgi:putative ABC transport system permease protein